VFLVDEQSAQSGASLPACPNGSKCAGLECQLQISVFVDDCGIVAAQLQQNSTEAPLNLSSNNRSHSARPSEGDKGDAGVLAHRFSDFRPSLKNGQHVGVDIILAEDLSNDLCSGDGD